MKKLPLCLTAAISFSLLNVATADPVGNCNRLMENNKYREAIPFCKEACNQNDGDGCNSLGRIYDKGLGGVREDPQQAKTYYEKSCNLNYRYGCFNLGTYYIDSDQQKSRTYYEKACNLNETRGCNIVGWFYAKGLGVRQNIQKAKEYYGKSCDLGDAIGCKAYRELNEKGYLSN